MGELVKMRFHFDVLHTTVTSSTLLMLARCLGQKISKSVLNVIAWISLSPPSDEEYTIAASARAATHSPFTLRSHLSDTTQISQHRTHAHTPPPRTDHAPAPPRLNPPTTHNAIAAAADRFPARGLYRQRRQAHARNTQATHTPHDYLSSHS